MRGIDEETLIAVRTSLAAEGLNTDAVDALISLKIRELNPWITLEEFLKSGFEGLCWIEFPSEIVTDAYYAGRLFKHSSTSDFAHDVNYITRVIPIHKPEPPKL